MPKLPKAKARSVAKAESEGRSREVYEPGIYRAKLESVEATTAKSSGNPMWIWKFRWTEKGMKGSIWENTVLSDEAEWKLNQIFSAFGVPPDTDTDELIGDEVRLAITVGTIQSGPRRGEERNEIDEVLPLEDAEDEEDDEEEDSEDDSEEDEESEDDEDEEEEDEEEEDSEDEPAPPPPSSKSGRKAVSASGAGKPAAIVSRPASVSGTKSAPPGRRSSVGSGKGRGV